MTAPHALLAAGAVTALTADPGAAPGPGTEAPSTAANAAITLSLQAAIDSALERSPDVQAALLGIEGAALSSERLDSAFAWNAFAEAGVNRDEAPRTNPFQSDTIVNVPVVAGFTRLFPQGTTVEVRATASYFDAASPTLDFGGGGGVRIPIIERGWLSGATVSARHPLYGPRPERQVELQKKEIAATADANGARAAEGTDLLLADVYRRFWAWVLAVEARTVAEEGLKSSKEIRDLVARKRARGLADDRDRLRAEAAVQQAEEQLLTAQGAVGTARRYLLERIGDPGSAAERPDYSLDIPADLPSLDESIARAEAASLALRALRSARMAQAFAAAIAEESLRPRLFALGRLDGQLLLPNGAGLDDDHGTVAFVGLRWERTFGDADAKTRIRQSGIETRRLDAETARARERLRTAVEEHRASIETAKARAAVAAGLVRTQEQRLAEEERNFSFGRAQLRDVIDARQQLTGARYLRAAALVSLSQASSELQLLDGTLTAPWREALARRAPAYRDVLTSPTGTPAPAVREGARP